MSQMSLLRVQTWLDSTHTTGRAMPGYLVMICKNRNTLNVLQETVKVNPEDNQSASKYNNMSDERLASSYSSNELVTYIL